MTDIGEPLRGNVAHPTRVGSTVRRDAGAWTPGVHALLHHLRRNGFDGVPRPLGFADDGREILDYIEGVDGRLVAPTEASLRSAMRLIRDFHDASVGFDAPRGTVWNAKSFTADRTGERAEIVGHNDLAPYNTIYRDGAAVAIVDWDFAAPSSRLWDFANAAWSFTPLYPSELAVRLGYNPDDTIARLRIVCDTYGIDDRARLLEVVETRLRATHDESHDYVRFVTENRHNWTRQLV